MMSTSKPIGFFQLVYTSQSLHKFQNNDLVDLLTKARAHNEQASITGVLIYKNGSFLQILEGDKTDVMEIFDKIKMDKRHDNVEIMLQNLIQQRVFSEWSMGLGISVEYEDQVDDLICFNLVAIIPFCVRSLFAPVELIDILTKFLDTPDSKLLDV